MKLIDKDALVAEIDKQKIGYNTDGNHSVEYDTTRKILNIIDTLEVIDPYEQCIQYASIEDGIKAHAEDYSFNIESLLFNQLTKEQQALWRKEIEQACISGGYSGLNLARDRRYNDTPEMKEVDSNDVFIAKTWEWVENNILSSSQQDKSLLYYEQFINYMEGE